MTCGARVASWSFSIAGSSRLCSNSVAARRETYRRLTNGLSIEQRRGLDALTQLRPEGSVSWLAWLRQLPEAATPSAMPGLMQKMTAVRRDADRAHMLQPLE